ncbi:hypothetical protein PSA7680_00068 [Pseudoruegeria aquimaris]|uniref:Uncharacterized protein n=1 Tax=Pseudoruegeria aquimaris TaxID=393663 RepID=A0A1Y5R772_9RHOB|nr:hypothetical protein [Pseudoruegeria aquimaris]SLN10745.1 hypothetical protein PSA7680_00068 [Pseudoruegeria aquimaris]
MNDLTPSRPSAPQVADRLAAVIAAVDAHFGEGYARENPALVASLVQSASIDAAVAAGEKAHGEAMGLAREVTRDVCETLLKLKPRFFG